MNKWFRGKGIKTVSTFRLWFEIWISLRVICKQPWASCHSTVLLCRAYSRQFSLLPQRDDNNMSGSLWLMTSEQTTNWKPSLADWSGGMSACCAAGPTVRWRAEKCAVDHYDVQQVHSISK